MSKAIFITGASSGIGQALALRYAATGVVLGLLARDTAGTLETVAGLCRARGAEVHTFIADVAEPDVTTSAIRAFLNETGAIDIVIANAGVNVVDDGSIEDTLRAAKDNMDVNYFGVINTISPFLETLKRQRRGALVIISSISSLRATHNSGPYSASKAAINLWSEGLRLRLRRFGIPVTTLCVGFVDTEMTRRNPFGMPGLISADKAARIIEGKIGRRTRKTVLPWTSGGLWTAFAVMPGALYDLVIDTMKRRNERSAT